MRSTPAHLRFTLGLVALLAWLAVPAAAQVEAELDAYWAELSRSVAAGDFDAYAALYHPDAVLVTPTGTNPIGAALDGWEQGFIDTAAGRMAAGVEFRFTDRRNDATTAFETGMFRYFSRPAGGEESVFLVRFTALLVKKDGRWLMVMEDQQDPVSAEEWAAAGAG